MRQLFVENANYSPRFVPYLIASGLLRDEPFTLIDVGCGMGIDRLWRVFEPDLVAHGFDAQLDEVERLARAERNPKVNYHPALVGLADDDPYHELRRATPHQPYFDPIQRSSAFAAGRREADRGRDSLPELNSWQVHPLATQKVGLSDFVREQGLTTVDFVKTDTDGGDYEVLLSADDSIKKGEILGFMVETPYNAQPDDTAHALHNVDQFLRRRGFLLYTMTVNRYSRAVLPAPFTHHVMAQTSYGQAIWGDLVYMRDAGSPNYAEVWGSELSTTKLLKLGALYELFGLQDCTVELLLQHEQTLSGLFDVRHALDLLTPPLNGREVSYDEYVAAFARDPSSFYPADRNPLVATARAVNARSGGRLLELIHRLRG